MVILDSQGEIALIEPPNPEKSQKMSEKIKANINTGNKIFGKHM